MEIQVSSSNFDHLFRNLEEMTQLTAKPTFSTRDEKRHNQLMLETSLLKKGMTPQEIRRFDQERLLKAAGMPKLPEPSRSAMDAETTQEWRNFASGGPVRPSYLPKVSEVRANEEGGQTISYTQLIPGGAFVATGMHTRTFFTMKLYNQLFDDAYCNVMETQTGALTTYPCVDDVSNSSVQTSEGVAGTEIDVANFGQKQLAAYTFRSGIVAVSNELAMDANFPIGVVLERVFALRHARGIGVAMVSGSGVSAPTGLVTGAIAAGANIVVASGAASNDGGAETGSTSIGSQDLWNAYLKLDPAYRVGAAWAMNDLTLNTIAQLVTKEGLPLVSFRKGLTDIEGAVPHILGLPVCIAPSFPNMSSGQNSVCLYNPLYFISRRVPPATFVQRFTQSINLATYDLTGFQSYLRTDCGLLAPNASYVPAVVIQQHS